MVGGWNWHEDARGTSRRLCQNVTKVLLRDKIINRREFKSRHSAENVAKILRHYSNCVKIYMSTFLLFLIKKLQKQNGRQNCFK